MPGYKVVGNGRVEYLQAANETQLGFAVRELYGDTPVIITPATRQEAESLMRSHSYPTSEEE